MTELDPFVLKARQHVADEYTRLSLLAEFDGGFKAARTMRETARTILLGGGKIRVAIKAFARILKRHHEMSVITDEMVEAVARSVWLHFDTHFDDDDFQRAIGGDTSHLDEYSLRQWNYSVERWPDNVGTHIGVEGFRKYARTALEAAQRFKDGL
jgi:hypothetical protein